MATEAKATILIVDDAPENLAVLSELLRPLYRVLAATSGEDALRVAGGQPKPDLILLDVMMPGMDGYSVLAELQADPATRDIPVLFLTVLAAATDEERGLQLGAADYITKPIQPTLLKARVRTQLLAKQARDWMAGQLLQSEKMASIGQLAAGVAHELNNPIGFVHSNLGTLAEYVTDLLHLLDMSRACAQQHLMADQLAPLEQAWRERDIDFVRHDILQLLAESRDGANRVRVIVKNLKDLAHVSDDELVWSDLREGLNSTLNIVWNELKYKAEVVKEYGDIPPILCMPAQLNQVFMNLLMNAGDAIQTRGLITIRTGASASEVWVEVEDTGEGIAPEKIGRIFEPFFTTKPVGQGTGLGLSVSQSIVAKHRGQITVRSEPGAGACFRVALPLIATEAAAGAAPLAAVPS